MQSRPGCSRDPDSPTSPPPSKRPYIPGLYGQKYPSLRPSYDHLYVYSDTEDISREIAEFYSYGEENTYCENYESSLKFLRESNLRPSWRLLDNQQKEDMLLKLLDRLDLNDREKRMEAARCILYVAQGCWDDILTQEELIEDIKINGMMLQRLGVFTSFVDLLKLELAVFGTERMIPIDCGERMMTILGVLYHIAEVIRDEKDKPESPYQEQIDTFCSDLLTLDQEEPLIITLFNLVARFADCYYSCCHFPIKKILLLLWKLILLALGGSTDLEEMKREKRQQNGLPPCHYSFEENLTRINSDLLYLNLNYANVVVSRDGGPQINARKAPKVRQEDYETFLQEARVKHIGYTLEGDTTTIAGFPESVRKSLQVMQSHIYTPLAKIQIEIQKKAITHPFSNVDKIEFLPTEILFQAMHPKFEDYILSLLKIFCLFNHHDRRLETQNPSTTSPKLVRLPRDRTEGPYIYNAVKKIDYHRYIEITMKALSAILILLLKHLKLNHVLQFECMCWYLMKYNALVILVNFFRQSIYAFINSINEMSFMEFPVRVLDLQHELTREKVELKQNACSPRNIFTCTNLLRVINKIAKWKEGRIIMLVRMDSKTYLKEFIHFKNDTLKMYAFKLIKMQMKYTSKEWRRDHLSVLTEIYMLCRLHLNDNFLSHEASENKQQLEKFNEEEKKLRKTISNFFKKRYKSLPPHRHTMDACILNVTDFKYKLPYCAIRKYIGWRQQKYLW